MVRRTKTPALVGEAADTQRTPNKVAIIAKRFMTFSFHSFGFIRFRMRHIHYMLHFLVLARWRIVTRIFFGKGWVTQYTPPEQGRGRGGTYQAFVLDLVACALSATFLPDRRPAKHLEPSTRSEQADQYG